MWEEEDYGYPIEDEEDEEFFDPDDFGEGD